MEALFDGLESVLVAQNDLHRSNHLTLGWTEVAYCEMTIGFDEPRDAIIEAENIAYSDYLDPMAALLACEEDAENSAAKVLDAQLPLQSGDKKRKREVVSGGSNEKNKKMRVLENSGLFDSGETVLSNTDDMTLDYSERECSSPLSDSDDLLLSEMELEDELRTQLLLMSAKTEHLGGGHPCEHCSLIFPTEEMLSAHSEQEHEHEHAKNLRVFECQYCDYVTTRKISVQLHVVQHHEPEKRKHRCSECGRTFARRDSLNRHQVVHDPSKRHMAREPKRKPRDKSGVGPSKPKQHVTHKSHAHACELCDSELSTGYSLRRHMHACHGIRA